MELGWLLGGLFVGLWVLAWKNWALHAWFFGGEVVFVVENCMGWLFWLSWVVVFVVLLGCDGGGVHVSNKKFA